MLLHKYVSRVRAVIKGRKIEQSHVINSLSRTVFDPLF